VAIRQPKGDFMSDPEESIIEQIELSVEEMEEMLAPGYALGG
jgi:hypothetical protein